MRDGPLPGELGGGLVVARRAGIVVEGVPGARIFVRLEGLAGVLQRLDVAVDAAVHAAVVFGVVEKQRGVDFLDALLRLAAVIGDRGREIISSTLALWGLTWGYFIIASVI